MNSEQAHQIGLCKTNAEFNAKLEEFGIEIVGKDRIKNHYKVFYNDNTSMHVRKELLKPGGKTC